MYRAPTVCQALARLGKQWDKIWPLPWRSVGLSSHKHSLIYLLEAILCQAPAGRSAVGNNGLLPALPPHLHTAGIQQWK